MRRSKPSDTEAYLEEIRRQEVLMVAAHIVGGICAGIVSSGHSKISEGCAKVAVELAELVVDRSAQVGRPRKPLTGKGR